MRIPALMLATVILLAGSLAAQSTPASISQFPPVDRVKVELKGADPMDTAARHMGAFWQLQQVIKQMTGLRWTNNQLTPEEKRLIGEYSAAYQAAGQPYASYPDRPKWYKMHAFYETSDEFREELFRRFLSAGIRGQWAQTEAQTKATVEAGKRAREQAVREEREQAEAAHKEFKAQLGIREPTESQRLAARCIAASRSESDCMIEAAARDFQKMVPISKNKARTPGLIISGVYSAAGGFSATFGTSGRGWVTCKGISAEATYKVERVGNQLQLKLLDYTSADLLGYGSEALSKLVPAEQMNPTEWQKQRVAFPVLADGKLSASGTIRVTGAWPVGTRSGTKAVTETQHGTRTRTLTPGEADAARRGGANPAQNGMTYTITEPTTTETTSTVPTSETIYETRTVTCPLAPMVPTGKATATAMGTSIAEGAGGALQMMFDVLGNKNPVESAAKKIPDPGLRMDGQYAGQDGFDVEFYPTSAVIACRDAAVSRDYTVSASAGHVLVNIQNGATQLVLELRPDGTLTGSGPVKVDGRIVTGQDASGNIAFRPVTDTCRVGVLTPK